MMWKKEKSDSFAGYMVIICKQTNNLSICFFLFVRHAVLTKQIYIKENGMAYKKVEENEKKTSCYNAELVEILFCVLWLMNVVYVLSVVYVTYT